MGNYSYRTADSPYEQLTNPVLEIGQVARMTFPEPPTLNEMLDMAKDRTRRGPGGVWLKRQMPVYWVMQKNYRLRASIELDAAGWKAPPTPWAHIAIVKAHFRVAVQCDPIERMARFKWPIDLLVDLGYLAKDSDRELSLEALPTQEVASDNRRADIWIRRDA